MLTQFEETACEAQSLLDKNPDWIERYAGYVAGILKNIEQIKKHKTKFHEWKPLFLYMPVGKAKGSANTFSLRFKGQDVATLSIKGSEIILSDKDFNTTNKNSFDFESIQKVPWDSPEAKQFRSQFSKAAGKATIGEHTFESALLSELEKNDKISKDSNLWGITPVKIADICRFQMKTPLAASELPITYSEHGGPLDILARVGVGAASSLCVMELKIAQKDMESAVHQGIAYTVFLQNLLQSESGKDWYKIFGYNRNLTRYDIKVCAVIPCASEKELPAYAGERITGNNGNIELHCMYVNTDWMEHGVKIEKSSFGF